MGLNQPSKPLFLFYSSVLFLKTQKHCNPQSSHTGSQLKHLLEYNLYLMTFKQEIHSLSNEKSWSLGFLKINIGTGSSKNGLQVAFSFPQQLNFPGSKLN